MSLLLPVRGEDHSTFSFHFFRNDFPQVTLGVRVHARAGFVLWRQEEVKGEWQDV